MTAAPFEAKLQATIESRNRNVSHRGLTTEASSDIRAARLESELRQELPPTARELQSRNAAARIVISLGPATVVAGFVWALLQPYRVTLFEPQGQSFWWLAVEPPLLVVLVGVVFHLAVARGLVRDLLEAERRRGSDR